MNDLNKINTIEEKELVLLSEPNKVPMLAGLSWFTQAWKLFTRRWGTWLIMFIIMQILMFAANSVLEMSASVPVLFWILMFVLCVIVLTFTGSIMLSCDALVEGDELEIGYLFSAFKYKFGVFFKLMLCTVGMIILFGMLIVFVSVAMRANSPQDDPILLLLWLLIVLFFTLPIFMMIWHAPALITLHDMTAWKSMNHSLKGCLKNLGAFLFNGSVWIVLSILLLFIAFLMIPGSDAKAKMQSIELLMRSIVSNNPNNELMTAFTKIIIVTTVIQFFYVILLNLNYYTSYRNIWTISKAKEKQ